MSEQEMVTEIAKLRSEIVELRNRMDIYVSDELIAQDLPNTMLLDQSFMKRAFAVLGHYLVAALIVMVPIYLLLYMLLLSFERG